MKDSRQEIITLAHFLKIGLDDPEGVMNEFKALPGAQYYPPSYDDNGNSFIYVPGTRDDRVLLTAHADTVFDYPGVVSRIDFDGTRFFSTNPDAGIGADDRAGCAIVYLLKDSGHSLLITNGEEYGCRGAYRIREEFTELFAELNRHSYILEFDRRNATDYKVYSLPVSQEFRKFIESNTGYTDAGKSSSTDIVELCGKICGANLSVGYYKEHTPEEYLVYSEWRNTLNSARKMLQGRQKRYPLS